MNKKKGKQNQDAGPNKAQVQAERYSAAFGIESGYIPEFIESDERLSKRQLDKINALQQKKATYEEILRRRLDDLEQDYAMLRMQSQELAVRNCKGQMQMNMAA